MDNCLFCKIIKGEIPADKVYEDSEFIAIKDINPQAPVHLLIIPKKHIPTVNDIEQVDELLIGKIYTVAGKLVKEFDIAQSGYRIIVNCNEDAGQVVFHLHFHVLGGKSLGWPGI